MRWFTGWRLPLRVARRDAARARGRSLLVVVMIALPVLAVTAAVVAQRTSDISPAESLDLTLGAAQARIRVDNLTGAPTSTPVVQNADASISTPVDDGSAPLTQVPVLTPSTLADALGGARVLPFDESGTRVGTDQGAVVAQTYLGDLADPLAAGLLDLTSGRLPRSAGEVVVNQVLLEQGYAVGEALRLVDAASTPSQDQGQDQGQGEGQDQGPTIVGVAESSTVRDLPVAAGPEGSLPAAFQQTTRSFLVGGDPIDWAGVQDLNALGAVVLSRAVVLDPPPTSELDPLVTSYDSSGLNPATLTVLLLVVMMALLEVVLLAGPAFAVGARRLQRTLALMAAAGGTPAQARRVVVGGAVVLGVVAAILGVVLGIGAGAVAAVVLQRYSSTWFGPFEVPVLPILGIAGFGLLSAVLAAAVPAWIASRQDVVAVLAGRRGDAAPSRRSPVLGVVLLGVGVGLAVLGARQAAGGETLIAGAALVTVLGMILLVPVVVALVARLAARLPLSLRYAARDAARHRTRTVPAVAAVAATVAGVVALLIANTSDGAQDEATYLPTAQDGVGTLYTYGEMPQPQTQALEQIIARAVPGSVLTPVRGLVEGGGSPDSTAYTYTSIGRAGSEPAQVGPGGADAPLLVTYGTSLGTSFVVSDDALPPGLLGVSDAERTAAAASLARGQVVAFTDQDPGADPVEADLTLTSETSDNNTGEVLDSSSQPLRGLLVHLQPNGGGPAAVLPGPVAETLGVPVGQTGLVVTGTTISPDEETAVTEAITGTSLEAGFSVERGYQQDDETLILQLILLGLGGVLMLGGTLTATFLALSDARPDLATLAAVGASPRRRRSVAAGYALVVGFVGALLGAAVGFVPGIAVSYPLTRPYSDGGGASQYLDVPWLMILGLVVALPLLTAAIVALSTRSRLPLVGRLD